MTVSGLILFMSIYGVAVATPGPGMAFVIARSLSKGLYGLPWLIAGFVAGDLVLCGLAYSGLAVVAKSFETAFAVVRYAGCVYLLWLAWKIWHAPVQAGDDSAVAVAKETPWQTFLSSFMLTIGNPKAIIFFVSIMPLAVDMEQASLPGFLQIAAVVVPIMTAVVAGYAVMADRARRLFHSSAALQRINRTTAVMMAGAAAAIAAKS